MAVYVDNFEIPYRRMLMSHMIADSTSELLAMAKTIGVNTKWLQDAGTAREHLEICKSKKRLAVKAGAIEISFRELAKRTYRKNRRNSYRYYLQPYYYGCFRT